MLIPFGVFSAAGASGGGGGAGSYELISTANGTGSSDTISFTSIASTYKHLQLRINARSTWAGNLDNFYIRLNNDGTANYSYHRLRGTNSTVTSAGGSGQSYIVGGNKYVGSAATAGITGVTILDILDYANTNKTKTVRQMSGGYVSTGSASEIVLASSMWNSTAAVNRIDLIDLNGFFTTVTRASLYGIKG